MPMTKAMHDADGEIAVEQQARIEKWRSAVRQWATKIHSDERADEGATARSRANSNQSSRWPRSRISCAAINGHRQGEEAGPVEAAPASALVWSRSANQMQISAQMPGRHDHEERGAPVVGFGRDAAEDRAQPPGRTRRPRPTSPARAAADARERSPAGWPGPSA